MAAKKPEIVYISIVRRKDASTTGPTMTLSSLVTRETNWMTYKTWDETMSFMAELLAERTPPDIRHDVTEKEAKLYSYGTSAGVVGVLIANAEYPSRSAKEAIGRIVDDFLTTHPGDSYKNLVKGLRRSADPIPWPKLQEWFKEYKDRTEDPLDKAQRELDETAQVLGKTIDSVLERGEKLDTLVSKSEGLSATSKMFYTQAKKQNSCCTVM